MVWDGILNREQCRYWLSWVQVIDFYSWRTHWFWSTHCASVKYWDPPTGPQPSFSLSFDHPMFSVHLITWPIPVVRIGSHPPLHTERQDVGAGARHAEISALAWPMEQVPRGGIGSWAEPKKRASIQVAMGKAPFSKLFLRHLPLHRLKEKCLPKMDA
jgi:hypothetical protein